MKNTSINSFCATKIIKTKLRKKMKTEFLVANMIIYIKKLTANFSLNLIIDEFKNLQE